MGRRLFAVDLRSLAALRIGLALLLLANGITRAADLEAHYSDEGVLPRSLLGFFPVVQGSFSIHALGGSVAWQATLFVLAGVFAVALGLGYRTRWATVASWALLVSLQNRNPMVLTGGDELLRLLLFWSCFLPLGARASLDARRSGGAPPAAGGDAYASPASAALLLQVALVYPIAAIFKWREPAWTGFDAITQALSVDGVATDVGRMLLAWPGLLRAGTASVLWFETVGVALAFVPDRRGIGRILAVSLFAAFHLAALGATMRIGLFPLVAATGWLAFLPPLFWNRTPLVRWLPPRPPASTGDDANEHARRPRHLYLERFVVGTAMLCVLFHDAATLGWVSGGDLGPPGLARTVTHALRLDQRWSLWTTPPANRYYVFAATLADGRRVDLHRDGSRLDWRHPSRRCPNNRWWKYELTLARPPYAALRPAYADFLVRRAASNPRLDSPVVALELWLLSGDPAEVRTGTARRILLWRSPPQTVRENRGRSGSGAGR